MRLLHVIRYMVALLAALAFAGAALQATEAKIGTADARPLPDPPGIHNLYLLGTNVYSGGTPEGDAGFAALAELGVKTIISVDGARPEVDSAKKHGLRYVHLPHGYDGISTNLQLQLAKASKELPGPIYVHCHHGKHRGPTAAAIICMTKDSWDAAQAEQWLKAAGTSTNYSGLYAVVRHFKKPESRELKSLPSDFPEVAKVSGMVDAMVAIDNTWENLKAIRTAGYIAPKNHPDLKPANEALLLLEHYREAQRLPEAAHHGNDFLPRLQEAEAEAKQAEELLRSFATKPGADIRSRIDTAFTSMANSCSSCHKAFRDQ